MLSAGITYWPCMVDNTCTSQPVPARTSQVLATMTDNVLEVFAAGPAGLTYPSQGKPGPSPQALLSTSKSQKSVAVRTK